MLFLPSVVFLILFLYFFYQYSLQKIKLNIVEKENEEHKARLILIENENKELSKDLEHLKSKSEYLQIKLNEQEDLNKMALENSKAVLVDLGNNLSKQLI